MTINTRAVETSTTAQPLDILALYRTMVTARVTNDLLKTRKTQGRFPFYIGCAGHASMAAVDKLPVMIVVEDNGWAITAASSIQWGGRLVDWARGGGVYAEEVDGTNTMATYETTTRLVEHIRSGQGPVLMHLRLGLLDAHSSSTDIKSYRKKEEIEHTTATKDPVKNFGRWLVEHGHIQEGDIDRIRKEVRAELERAESQILREPEPTAERVMQHVIEIPEWRENTPRGARRQSTMLAAINEALTELAERDPYFFVYGQDVGSPKGGVFGATTTLVTKFPDRAISSPLNVQVIVGVPSVPGILDGKARCAEIQFVDYHQSAAQTIRLAARILYQNYGDWHVPLLIRTKSGSGGGGPISSSTVGGGAYGHSNTREQWFTTIPGMITICPATPFDAKGLLLEAARAQSPVTFLERGRLYRSEPPKDSHGNIIAAMAEYWKVPDGYYTL